MFDDTNYMYKSVFEIIFCWIYEFAFVFDMVLLLKYREVHKDKNKHKTVMLQLHSWPLMAMSSWGTHLVFHLWM